MDEGGDQEPAKNIDFGTAIRFLRKGKALARIGWNDKNMWLMLQVPDSNSKMSLPYIYVHTADGKLVPWFANQTDILSYDWEVVS